MAEFYKCFRCGREVVIQDHDAALKDYEARFETDHTTEPPVVICDECNEEIRKLKDEEEDE